MNQQQTSQPSAKAPARNLAKRKRVLVIVAAVAGIVVGYLVYRHINFVNTDDAYVQAHTVMLAARVPGTVDRVLVEENQRVKSGQLLVQLDDRDYKTKLTQAEADSASLSATLADAEKNFKRLQRLFAHGAVARQQLDDAEANYKQLSEKAKAAISQVDQARLNLSYTHITAPEDGIVAKKSVEPGAFVPVGQALIGFVSAKERWVTANFKETELPDIKIGSKASVSVDAIPHRQFEGEVESINPATGASFALLPPDNATGNFTKVVQRVPVRIKLNHLTDDDISRLQAGLSAIVDVHKR